MTLRKRCSISGLKIYSQHTGKVQECQTARLTVGLITTQKVLVPPESEMEIMVRASDGGNTVEGEWIVESNPSMTHGVAMARAIVCPKNGLIPLRILNPRNCNIPLKKGTELARMERIEGPVVNLSAVRGTDTGKVSTAAQETLWSLASKVGDQISAIEKELIFTLLCELEDVFSFSSTDLGRTSILRHHINTGDEAPVHLPPRRVPQARREEVRRLLREMLESGVVEPSDEPWSSPVVLAQKKDGSLRFCVDYRRVNAITRKDAYPLPRVDDTLDTWEDQNTLLHWTSLAGYWQVEVAADDRPKTAFTTPEGLYQFKVMPFGLCNAPATFQRLMGRVLSGLKWSSCLVYLDDIIVVGNTFEDHLHHIGLVLKRLRDAGLKLKPVKCNFCQQQVSFLGHIVSPQGIATDPNKTDAIAKWPTPQSRREADGEEYSFRMDWTATCQQAFDNLRNCLMTSPVLAYLDYSKRFLLDTDASDYGIGAVLSQHFRQYLLGREFTLRTDHGSLVWIQNFKEPEGQVARWLERLAEYNFKVVHRRSTKHNNAPPEQVHSDQGRQFESELLKQICNLLQIKKTHTTPYRPQGNGMVERFNWTLQDMLAIAVGKHPADWEVQCFTYNTSVHSSTGS
ncbi:hypothetical protein EMCRGX_G005060 [Ephydatia muelleri]